MHKKEIRVGGVYEVRIGKSLTEAAVNRIDKGTFFITDLSTHRRGEVKTAAKFIRYLRMNVEVVTDLPAMKPLEEHTPPKVATKDMESQRAKLRKARRLLEEVDDLVGYQDIKTRVQDSIERVGRAIQSLSGPNGKTPYAQVEIDLDDVEEQRTNVQAAHTLMKRVGNAQMAERIKTLLGEVDRFLITLAHKGKGQMDKDLEVEDEKMADSKDEEE